MFYNATKKVTPFLFIFYFLLFTSHFSLIHAQETKEQNSLTSEPVNLKKGEFSFNFDDEDVFSLIQTIFGEILKVNYIIDPQVKGRVNLRTVTPVAKEDILPLMEVILRLSGIGIVEENNLYRIIPISGISKEPAPIGIGREAEKIQITGKALVQVVPVKYTKSSDMIKVLTPFLSANAQIIDVPKSNHITIIDTDANIKRLLQLVEIFDSEYTKQVKPQVFVYPVQNSKAKDMASILQQIFLGVEGKPATTTQETQSSLSGQTGNPQPLQASVQKTGEERLASTFTRIFPDEITNTIIVLATPEEYEMISEIIKKIDIVPRQVLIEGLIARVDLTDELRFGLAWSIATDLQIDLRPFSKRDYDFDAKFGQNPSGLSETLSGSGFTFLATDKTGTIKARLEALALEGKVDVMATPHILVSDNREAKIQVGQQVPIRTVQTTATVTTTSIQYKDIGIILTVKPQINESGLVTLEITQEVSSSATSLEDIAAGASPVINKTGATTHLVARDSETIIIGGLIREDKNKSRTGIPILSQIPILGYLFGSTTTVTTKVELVILLTPHVIKNRIEASDITSEYVERFKGVAKDKKIEEFIDREKPP